MPGRGLQKMLVARGTLRKYCSQEISKEQVKPGATMSVDSMVRGTDTGDTLMHMKDERRLTQPFPFCGKNIL